MECIWGAVVAHLSDVLHLLMVHMQCMHTWAMHYTVQLVVISPVTATD